MATTLENVPVKYTDLISDIETGQVKIPQFQRKFVWGIKASASLIDSILKGYPIGTFIFWRTNERLRSVRNIGNINLPEPTDGEYVNFVLDGQQRLTSLFAAIKGVTIQDDDGNAIDYSSIYLDLAAESDSEIVIIDVDGRNEKDVIRLTDLMQGGLTKLASYPEQHHDRIEHYKNVLTGYTFSVINLKNAPIEVATEVFERLNVGGKALTLFEIMVAKTYHIFLDNGEEAKPPFDLSEAYDNLLEELKDAQYDTVPTATVLQVVAILLAKDCTRKSILKLDKMRFIAIWPEAVECIKNSIDFFGSYGIVVGRILPYNALIVPFSYFFHKHKQNPTGDMKKQLIDFFWRASLGFRYSSGVESKLAQDIEKIDQILAGKHPRYEWSVDTSESFIREHGTFSTGRSLIKAVLCLFAQHNPKAFDTDLVVHIDNQYLKRSNSRNYHHFFPRSYMTKHQPQWEQWQVNHVANITLINDDLNKNKIRAKAPSVYMKTFGEENSGLAETMKTHLIDDLDGYGIWNDDYKTFFDKRVQRISAELNARIIPQRSEQPLEVYQDIEEPEEAEG